MPDLCSFEYAVVRVVPRVDREEFLNTGVVLYCRERRFLAAQIRLDTGRLAALAPELDPGTVQRHLELIPRICAGGPAAGPIGQLSQVERFRWLTSPRSTVIQVSPVHCGLCTDPEAELEDLIRKVVGRPDVP
jgi:hypothetical protein